MLYLLSLVLLTPFGALPVSTAAPPVKQKTPSQLFVLPKIVPQKPLKPYKNLVVLHFPDRVFVRTLEDAINATWKNNLKIRSLAASLKAVYQKERIAFISPFFPSLSFGPEYNARTMKNTAADRPYDPRTDTSQGTSFSYGTNMQLTLGCFLKRPMAQCETQQTLESVLGDVQEILKNVVSAFLNCIKISETIALYQVMLKGLEQSRKEAQQRRELGAAVGEDWAKVDATCAKITSKIIDLQAQLFSAQASLAMLTGGRISDTLVKPDIPNVAVPAWDMFLQTVLKNSPTLRREQWITRHAHLKIRETCSKFGPTLTVRSDTNMQNSSKRNTKDLIESKSKSEDTTLSMGLKWNLNIDALFETQGSYLNASAASYSLHQKAAEELQKARTLYAQYYASLEKREPSKKELLHRKMSYKNVEESHRQGVSSFSDVLDRRNDLLESEIQSAERHVEAVEVMYKLAMAMGAFKPVTVY